MAYKKPQDPLTNNGFGIYPLTTADQVILSDGSRLEKNGQISIGGGTVKTVSGVAPDSAGNVALTASDVGALAADGTASDSSKLGGRTWAERLLDIYPVGSIYISVASTSPASLFGGTWQILNDVFLLAAGSYANAGTFGGEATHQHSYGFQYGAFYGSLGLESSNADTAGLLSYDSNNNITLTGHSTKAIGNKNAIINNAVTTSNKTVSMAHYRMIANTSNTSNIPPYLAVYMWKRVS